MNDKNLPALYSPAVGAAGELIIKDDLDLQQAAKIVIVLNNMRQIIVDDFLKSKDAASKAYKEISSQEKRHLDKVDKAIEVLRSRSNEYIEGREGERPLIEGMFFRDNDQYEVTDKTALINSVVMGDLPQTLLRIDMRVLKGLIDAGLVEVGAKKDKKTVVVFRG